MGLFLTVNLLVFLELTCRAESFVADFTAVGPRIAVSHSMSSQTATMHKSSPTLLTLVQLATLMQDPYVPSQRLFCHQGVVADSAFEGSGYALVSFDMCFKTLPLHEALAATVTGELICSTMTVLHVSGVALLVPELARADLTSVKSNRLLLMLVLLHFVSYFTLTTGHLLTTEGMRRGLLLGMNQLMFLTLIPVAE